MREITSYEKEICSLIYNVNQLFLNIIEEMKYYQYVLLIIESILLFELSLYTHKISIFLFIF